MLTTSGEFRYKATLSPTCNVDESSVRGRREYLN